MSFSDPCLNFRECHVLRCSRTTFSWGSRFPHLFRQAHFSRRPVPVFCSPTSCRGAYQLCSSCSVPHWSRSSCRLGQQPFALFSAGALKPRFSKRVLSTTTHPCKAGRCRHTHRFLFPEVWSPDRPAVKAAGFHFLALSTSFPLLSLWRRCFALGPEGGQLALPSLGKVWFRCRWTTAGFSFALQIASLRSRPPLQLSSCMIRPTYSNFDSSLPTL